MATAGLQISAEDGWLLPLTDEVREIRQKIEHDTKLTESVLLESRGRSDHRAVGEGVGASAGAAHKGGGASPPSNGASDRHEQGITIREQASHPRNDPARGPIRHREEGHAGGSLQEGRLVSKMDSGTDDRRSHTSWFARWNPFARSVR